MGTAPAGLQVLALEEAPGPSDREANDGHTHPQRGPPALVERHAIARC
ncbi:MAG: hypothetical protein HY535_07210 [Chloroflexi bacterium]|nr:hypothetical protein [Chloroflexota bacterium]